MDVSCFATKLFKLHVGHVSKRSRLTFPIIGLMMNVVTRTTTNDSSTCNSVFKGDQTILILIQEQVLAIMHGILIQLCKSLPQNQQDALNGK